MTGFFGCKMLFTYLGLPMETTRPRVEHYALIMNRMKRQLTSISSMLTHVGQLSSILITNLYYVLSGSPYHCA
jgi:hypothetical protein